MIDKSVAIIQPYFMPYLGYFQLLEAVDEVILLDNVQFIKSGWINRNRISNPEGKIEWMTIPLQAGSNRAQIAERNISSTFSRENMLKRISGIYSSRPYGDRAIELLSMSIDYEDKNLSSFLTSNLKTVCNFIGINTPIIRASDVIPSKDLTGTRRLIDICHARNAKNYVNPIGGRKLYKSEDFLDQNIRLKFLNPRLPTYEQGYKIHNEALSILDLVANLSPEDLLQSIKSGFRIEDS